MNGSILRLVVAVSALTLEACSGESPTTNPIGTAGGTAEASGGSGGAGGAPSGGGGTASGGSPVGGASGGQTGVCPTEPPRRSAIALWFDALDLGEGVSTVEEWSNRGSAATRAGQTDIGRRPTVVRSDLDGEYAVRFDGENDSLSFDYPVAGRSELTIASVSRTHTYELANYNADCDFDKDGLVEVGRELNCSATDNALVAWNERDNEFAGHGVFFNIAQEEVSFRIGTGEEYALFKTPFVLDEPRGDKWTWSLGMLRPGEAELLIDGVRPLVRRDYVDETRYSTLRDLRVDEGGIRHEDWPLVVGPSEDVAWIGRGRFDNPGGHWPGELALLLVYDVALTEGEVNALGQYLACRYPNRVQL